MQEQGAEIIRALPQVCNCGVEYDKIRLDKIQ